ncbi:olfactory receptor 4B13-like [Pholidichthys leucotaenia]
MYRELRLGMNSVWQEEVTLDQELKWWTLGELQVEWALELGGSVELVQELGGTVEQILELEGTVEQVLELGAAVEQGLELRGAVVQYLYFFIVISLYVFIIAANVLLIVVICMSRSLHEPMYMFLCSLFVNELYGSTGLFPFLLVQIISDVHTVSAPLCFLQIFCVYTYASIQFCNLAVMSYDRYLAICCPLQYSTRMTSNNVAILIALSWLYPFVAMLLLISLSSPLQLCGNIIHKVYCDNYSIVKLACSDTTVNNIYGLLYTCILALLVFLILNSYVKILKVCFSGSRQMRQKALSTCTPHLASLCTD